VHIGVPLETHAGVTRVAATPETIKKLVGQGHHQVVVLLILSLMKNYRQVKLE
jgi:NAD/NADP transhydrogenase alpha subunit